MVSLKKLFKKWYKKRTLKLAQGDDNLILTMVRDSGKFKVNTYKHLGDGSFSPVDSVSFDKRTEAKKEFSKKLKDF